MKIVYRDHYDIMPSMYMKMDLKDQLLSIKGLILDLEGVWFEGKETRGVLSSGEAIVFKTRSVHDGQGLSFLRAIGIRVVFAGDKSGPLGSIIDKINTLPSVTSGTWPLVDCLADTLKKETPVVSIEAWLQKHDLNWSDCAYIGDDRTDLEAMTLAGIKVAPADAQRIVKKIADIVLTKNGGQGAVREFAEMVLDARGVDEGALPAA